jgi:hypothetical protein
VPFRPLLAVPPACTMHSLTIAARTVSRSAVPHLFPPHLRFGWKGVVAAWQEKRLKGRTVGGSTTQTSQQVQRKKVKDRRTCTVPLEITSWGPRYPSLDASCPSAHSSSTTGPTPLASYRLARHEQIRLAHALRLASRKIGADDFALYERHGSPG